MLGDEELPSEPLTPLRVDSYGATSKEGEEEETNERFVHPIRMVLILATAFAYGCIFITLFLITIPVECTRIQKDYPSIQRSVSLGVFIAVAGVCQLISPLMGMMSDTFTPPTEKVGQRLPYLVFGAFFTILGIIGQWIFSVYSVWIGFAVAFVVAMLGINIVYGMMIALIPDQFPRPQTGMANGTLAFLIVTGSLFGFAMFHTTLASVQYMYLLYAAVAFVGTTLTAVFSHERDVALAWERRSSNHHHHAQARILLGAMLVDPFRNMNWKQLGKSYTIDRSKYPDFFVVTVSRLFYFMGVSVQSFFLYFLHDVIHQNNPRAMVASLAILAQIAGAVTCYPAGVISDRMTGRNRRRSFVYVACAVVASVVVGLTFCRTILEVLILVMFFGACNGIYITMDTSLAVDTLPKEHDEDGSGNAQLLGIWGVAGFMGSAIGPLIGGSLLSLVGHQPVGSDGIQSYSIAGYAVVLALSSSYFVVSALILRFFIKDPNI